ncbi:MAG: hypothetical protein DCC67_07105 [Planctomycetota bacterium]|nr:MAG: hypothetical protein DCC67_07105 [Planctomycetota bacterium]
MGEPLRQPLDPHTAGRGHEASDVAVRPLMIFLGALAASLAVVALALVALFNLFEAGAQRRDPALPPLAVEGVGPTGPRLQVSPREDLQQFHARETRLLNSTAWINRPAGIVRIPIDRAIELSLERGLPQWPAVEATTAAAQASADRPRQEQPATPAVEDPSAPANEESQP